MYEKGVAKARVSRPQVQGKPYATSQKSLLSSPIEKRSTTSA
jgi:hypothetical protein